MKIPVEKRTYQEVMTYKPWSYRKPCRQSKVARWLLKTLSEPELRKVNFEYTQEGMEQLGAKEPALFLMNHSSFLDLEIASYLKLLSALIILAIISGLRLNSCEDCIISCLYLT